MNVGMAASYGEAGSLAQHAGVARGSLLLGCALVGRFSLEGGLTWGRRLRIWRVQELQRQSEALSRAEGR